MQRNIILSIFLIIVLSGCYQDHVLKVEKPPDLISENKLSDIITEMDIIEGMVTYNRIHAITNPSVEKDYYLILFEHYGVTAPQVRGSIRYYIAEDDVMAHIYDKVLSRFSMEQSLLYEKRNAGQRLYLDSAGILQHQMKLQWIYSKDSLIPYCFKPIF